MIQLPSGKCHSKDCREYIIILFALSEGCLLAAKVFPLAPGDLEELAFDLQAGYGGAHFELPETFGAAPFGVLNWE